MANAEKSRQAISQSFTTDNVQFNNRSHEDKLIRLLILVPADSIKVVYEGMKHYCPIENIIKQSEVTRQLETHTALYT